MPSVWIERRGRRRTAARATASSTGSAAARARIRYGGSFTTKREATARRGWVAGELAAMRVPDLGSLADPVAAPTLREAASAGGEPRRRRREHAAAASQPVSDAPRRSSATRRVDEITPADVAELVAALAANGQGARDDPQEPARARDGARPRRRHAEPGPRQGQGAAAARGEAGDRPSHRRAVAGRPRAAAAALPAAAARPRRDRHAGRRARATHLGRPRRAAAPLARLAGRLEDGTRALGHRPARLFAAVLRARAARGPRA